MNFLNHSGRSDILSGAHADPYASVYPQDPFSLSRWWRVAVARRGLAVLAFLSAVFSASAQWTTQTIPLKPGWNAVYLELDPEPAECDSQFAGLPVESVWAWNRKFTSVQFIQDPDKLVPGQAEWLTWLPATHAAETLGNLFLLRGAQPYLIKVQDGAAAFNWVVTGRPRLPSIDWLSDSFNFVGFSVSAVAPPTFQSFFGGSTNQAGKPVYRLNANGSWDPIVNLLGTSLKNAESFWVRSDGRSTFSGPVLIDIPGGTDLTFGWQNTEATLRLKNVSAVPRTVTLKVQNSIPAPSGWPTVAGAIPFSYYSQDLPGWTPLPAAGLSSPILAPGGEWLVRLEVRRRDMVPFAGTSSAVGALYQSVLEVSDGNGFRQQIGVTAEGPNAKGSRPVPALRLADAQDSVRAGLWVGNVILQNVSQPSKATNPDVPTPVSNPLQFRILVHVDAAGKAKLVQKVLLMWKPGTFKPDSQDPTQQVIDQPGRFVLVTDDSLIPNWSGVTLRDGDPVPRRVSTVAYALKTPLAFTGSGEFGANTLTTTLTLDYDDRLNPFKHKFHPDHDNLTERFDQKLPEGQESFNVTRQISLAFSSTDPEGLRLAGWGDTQIGGTYTETMTGVHRRPIYLKGVFRLNRVSRVSVLNDGL